MFISTFFPCGKISWRWPTPDRTVWFPILVLTIESELKLRFSIFKMIDQIWWTKVLRNGFQNNNSMLVLYCCKYGWKRHFYTIRLGYLKILNHKKNLDNGFIFRRPKSFGVIWSGHWVQIFSAYVIRIKKKNGVLSLLLLIYLVKFYWKSN